LLACKLIQNVERSNSIFTSEKSIGRIAYQTIERYIQPWFNLYLSIHFCLLCVWER